MRVFGALEVLLLLDKSKQQKHQEHVEEDGQTDVSGKGAALADQLLLIPFANGTVWLAVAYLISGNFL